MAPFAEDLLDEFTDLGEIPLVTTRKHIVSQVPEKEPDLTESETDSDASSTSSALSQASIVGTLLEFDPCAAAAERFASCSNCNYSASYVPCSTPTSVLKIRSCFECGRWIKNIKPSTDSDLLDVNEREEEACVDVVIDAENQIYCQECCAKFQEWKRDHSLSYTKVMSELLSRVNLIDETEAHSTVNPQESKRLEDLIAGCVDRERTRKGKGRRLGAITRAMKSSFSSKKSKHLAPEPVVPPTEPEAPEEKSEEIQAIQTIFSSSKRVRYYPQKKNKRARKGNSKKKHMRDNGESNQIVRAVAVVWS